MSTSIEPQSATTTTWNLDPDHSVAEFKVKHMMISNVKGQFTRIKGTLNLDETNVTNSSVEASAPTLSRDFSTTREARDEEPNCASLRSTRQGRCMSGSDSK